MKHRRFELIWWLILANAILLFLTWSSFQSHIWKTTTDYSDVLVRLFHVIGIIATFIGINYVIEFTTRIKDSSG